MGHCRGGRQRPDPGAQSRMWRLQRPYHRRSGPDPKRLAIQHRFLRPCRAQPASGQVARYHQCRYGAGRRHGGPTESAVVMVWIHTTNTRSAVLYHLDSEIIVELPFQSGGWFRFIFSDSKSRICFKTTVVHDEPPGSSYSRWRKKMNFISEPLKTQIKAGLKFGSWTISSDAFLFSISTNSEKVESGLHKLFLTENGFILLDNEGALSVQNGLEECMHQLEGQRLVKRAKVDAANSARPKVLLRSAYPILSSS